MDEQWKIVANFTNYTVSDLGRIRSYITYTNSSGNPHIMKPQINTSGYLQIGLTHNKQRYFKLVHIIVLENFTEEYLWREEVNHIDGDKLNNKLSNLEWVSRSENMTKAYQANLYDKSGENNSNAHLCKQDVYDIRKSLQLNLYTMKQLSWMFDVDITHIGKIKNNLCWM